MLGIEKLLEKLMNRQKLPKDLRGEFDFDIKTKYVHGLLFYNRYFDEIVKALGKDTICFIVGGWIRDRLLNRPIKDKVDIDLLVTKDPFEIAKEVKKVLGKGNIFQFEKEKTVASLIFEDNGIKYRFDFSYLDITDIMENKELDFYDKEKAIIERLEQDLLTRDFTINAMAIVFDDAVGLGASETVLFDPSGGLEDLQEGIVKPVSIENIQKDPVRVLRGFRIAQSLDFDIDKDFKKWCKKNREIVKNSPIERLRDEILKIFDNEGTEKTLRELVDLGILQQIVPEIEDMVKIKNQGNIHKYPLLEHSLKTVEYMEDFLKKKRF